MYPEPLVNLVDKTVELRDTDSPAQFVWKRKLGQWNYVLCVIASCFDPNVSTAESTDTNIYFVT